MTGHSGRTFSRFWKFARPKGVVGHRKVRIGGPNDGGYVMVDDFAGLEQAISVGIGTDVSWDLDIAARGMQVFQFDHTVNGPPAAHPRFRFRQVRLGVRSRPPAMLSLGDFLSECVGPVVGKIDIEGDEWPVFAEIDTPTLKRFRQLVIEFHFMALLTADVFFSRAFKAMKNINKTHQTVHVHGNNYSTMVEVGEFVLPDVVEITFASRSHYRFFDELTPYPTQLDAPNNPRAPDMPIGVFAP